MYVGRGQEHPGLYRTGLFIPSGEIHWVNPYSRQAGNFELNCQVRIRYRQPLQNATILGRDEGYYILFEQPQRGITAGQFAAWYKNGELLGSGVINS